MRRRSMMCSHDNLKANKSKEGDVCMYDKTNNSLLFVKIQDVESDIYPSDSYTPIGVVVVPGTHNVYGTGECAVICLSDLYTKLSNNSYYNTTRNMYWGIYNTTTTTFHTMVPYVAEYKQQREDSTIEGYIKLKKFYSDDPEPTFATDDTEYADEICLHDTNRYYYANYVYIRYAPSPYFTDGTRNPNYYNIIETNPSKLNLLSDFDGRGNTDRMLLIRGEKDYTEWDADSETLEDFPAFSCCDKYYTDGTKQGDWYLPSSGELGYLIANYKKINTTIEILKTKYNTNFTVLGSSSIYHSSTEYTTSQSIRLFSTFGLNVYDKDRTSYVRAFMRVK